MAGFLKRLRGKRPAVHHHPAAAHAHATAHPTYADRWWTVDGLKMHPRD